MNVVIVNDYAFVNGGAGKVALSSALGLASLGHNVTLFTGVGPAAPELLDVARLQVICLGQREIVDNPNRAQAVVQGLWNFKAASRMRALLVNFDRAETVIHVHGWTKALSSSVIQVALSLGFRVIITLHDYFTACPTGTFYDHKKRGVCHLQPMSGACISTNCDSRNYGHKIWRVGRQWIQRQIGLIPAGINDYISISDLSEEVLKPFLPRASRIYRVPNFIDAKPNPLVDVGTNRYFTFSGRLSAEKGPLLLASCSRHLGIETLFIGDGPLRNQIESVAPKAFCTGWLPPAEALLQLRRSRALVFPSLWYEGQPLVVAEAAAMGIPAIVPDTCAARERVIDGVTGLWFKGGDVNDLMEKIRYLNENPGVSSEMGRAAYQRCWQSPLTLDAHCKAIQEIYRTVLTTLN